MKTIEQLIADNPEIIDANKVVSNGIEEVLDKGWATLTVTINVQGYRITKIKKTVDEAHIVDKTSGRFLLDNPSHSSK